MEPALFIILYSWAFYSVMMWLNADIFGPRGLR